jgi:hypothetical protein
MRITAIKSTLTLILFVALAANAQNRPNLEHDSLTQIDIKAKAARLPNIQQISLRAPANAKIDGKATEWNDQFQAFNHATEIFYTIANDDKKLYLTIQAVKPFFIINKILSGGIIVTINTSGKKSIKNAASITYPTPQHGKLIVNSKAMPALDNQKLADSVMNVYNNRLTDKEKTITVTGITGIDSLISIYNTDGIKAAGLFNNKMAYTYELAIDLKLLNLNTDDVVKFSYNITLPGYNKSANLAAEAASFLKENGMNPNMFTPVPGQTPLPMEVPTDFWGEYTLMKK